MLLHRTAGGIMHLTHWTNPRRANIRHFRLFSLARSLTHFFLFSFLLSFFLFSFFPSLRGGDRRLNNHQLPLAHSLACHLREYGRGKRGGGKAQDRSHNDSGSECGADDDSDDGGNGDSS
jgi:hypothetical protein